MESVDVHPKVEAVVELTVVDVHCGVPLGNQV